MLKMTPLISIITVNFNDKIGLERTLESVFSQNFRNFEYLVIDGGSNDGSKELLEKNSEKINYWVSEPDKGIYNAMNKGISVAKGEYLIFLNSGDHFKNENSLEIAQKYLGKEDIIYGDLELVGNTHTFIKEYPKHLSLYYFYESSLPHPATFIRKELFKKFGYYDESLKIVSDWKWFLRVIMQFSCTYKKIPKVLSTFYQDGISSNSSNIIKIEAEREIVFKEHYPEYIDYFKEIHTLKEENKILTEYKKKYAHLKNYKLVRLFSALGLVKIYK